ncbi:hypothetical protein [Xenorhabdus bovienii]|uniref:Uncharacterized protein n=1 Tax=Xenorhabdus bovienii str. kraussei Becker Underwood TaxID=1398204 RepID=A0A077PW72_XENBV|nr:hypothetical protein [Xenorhabdus bovienii]CDH24099.1 hypothetical protein XBKB1_2380015 [Xenorhabdus bovienii str. kraussei Becker Underwood]
MKDRAFSKRWFKNIFCFFIKEIIWSNIPVVAVFIWGILSLYLFPDDWGVATSVGSVIIVALYFILIYINEKKKS